MLYLKPNFIQGTGRVATHWPKESGFELTSMSSESNNGHVLIFWLPSCAYKRLGNRVKILFHFSFDLESLNHQHWEFRKASGKNLSFLVPVPVFKTLPVQSQHHLQPFSQSNFASSNNIRMHNKTSVYCVICYDYNDLELT